MHKRLLKTMLSFLLILIIQPACVQPVYAQPEKALATPAKPDSVALPIIMYHQLSQDYRCWNDYVVGPEKLESDLEALSALGFTPVYIKQLTEYANGRCKLPEKPILLTFDDGDINFYRLVYPIIKEYNVPVVLSPVAKWVEAASDAAHPKGAYITFSQAQEMEQSGLVEFGNHTYGLHSCSCTRRGVLSNPGEDPAQYRTAIYNDVGKAQSLWEKATGTKPAAFTYPYGFYSKLSEEVLHSMGFTVTLTCYEKVNRISGPESLYLLGRYNRPNSISSEAFFNRINRLVEKANNKK
ncbi:polysaccharide deacetylase family protein [Acetanaerobacterium elongatum]|uniref:Biofilm PGA synthesis lipoprotein PgaB n=1 Tax=Acetanaerobacterium elongatum TaxID=258515 RepID=A0A1H0FCN2_9FIRM|nr:polysaccharide deacetylase family protein [Acetanaerobacterium elongatum]SDN92262.1 biofilm PGA synthesis lipoprotein PgaB [Acetanaerobacterium elongatum]